MQAYRTNSTVTKGGNLSLRGLPFREGDEVEIIVLRHRQTANGGERYPLRGQPVRYDDPFASVADDDWHVLEDKR